MGDGFEYKSPGIITDIILEFDKSIKNIQEFSEQMAQLDARFGSLEQRIDNMRNSLAGLHEQSSKSVGSNLRRQLEQELNNIIASSNIVLSSIGDRPIKLKTDTVKHLFARVDAELNRAILKQISNINVKIDPSFNTGVIPIGKDEFEQLNREIARLVKTQTKVLVEQIHKNAESLIDPADLKGLSLSIGKGTVSAILQDVKRQLMPILMNPEIPASTFSFSQADINAISKKIKNHLKEALAFDFQGILNKGNEVDEEIRKTAARIDGIVTNYIKNIRQGLYAIDPRTAEVPIDSLSRRLRTYIARDLGVTERQLESQLKTIDAGSATSYELKRQFSSLERTINSKLTSGTSKLITQLRQSVRQVEFEPTSSLKHYLISEINKLNNEIVKKIREQIDKQFEYMKAEVSTVNTDPRNINRNGKISRMASGYGARGGTINQTIINNNYGNKSERPSYANLADPYARRDAYFNTFGLEGALINTIRHILAGGLVGAPIAAAYKAFDSFQTSQLEQLKIAQNYMMKPEFQTTDSKGNLVPNFSKVEQEMEKLVPTIRKLAGFYAIDYGEMSKVASIASRLTSSQEEAETFMDYATMIYRLDNEGDLVNTIAPGFEAIIGQFKMSVWEMDDVVKAFAVATNTTKATTDDLMKALARSGAMFYNSNISPEEAIMMTASALQSTGLSGEDIGNMFKTLNARLAMESVRNKLEEYGISVYETDEYGRKVRRDGLDVFTDLANLAINKGIGQDQIDELFNVTAGGYQIGKFMAFIESLNNLGLSNESGLNVHEMIEQARQYEMDAVYSMLSKSMNSNILEMQRIGVEWNIALTSILESLAPAIAEFSDVLVNFAHDVRDNSDMWAQVMGMLVNSVIGFAAIRGSGYLLNKAGYQQNLDRVILQEKIWGGQTLSRRPIESNLGGLDNMFDSRSKNRLKDDINSRKFMELAMSKGFEGYYRELAEMDEKRRNEIQQYIRDTRGRDGKLSDMADLFMVMDESRGYKGRRKMTADEVHRNAAFNARQLIENKSMANLFTKEFADELSKIMSNRKDFLSFNATSDNRAFSRDFARMDTSTRGDFANFLERNYASVGKTIDDMEGLKQAFIAFNDEQRKAQIEARNTNPTLVNMRKTIDEIERSMSKTAKTSDKFLDFLDELGRRGKAVLPTVLELTKNLLRLSGQVFLFSAVGDVISGVSTNIGLTEEQRELRDANTALESDKRMSDMLKSLNNKDYGAFIGSGLAALYNTVTDLFKPGNQSVGINDLLKSGREFDKWLSSKEGKQMIKEASQEKGRDLTKNEILDLYLANSETGKKQAEKEKENFMKEYNDMLDAEAKREEMKRDAQRMREERQKELLDAAEPFETITETLEALKTALEDIRLENTIELIKAQLNGVKTNSEEYLRLRKQQLQEEQELYEKQIEATNKRIEELKEQMKELEESGKDYEEDEEGNRQKTKEYRDLESSLEKEENRKEEMEKEFGIDYYNNLLEQRRLAFQILIKPIEEMLKNADYNRSISDLNAQLMYSENSKELYSERIRNAEKELADMKAALAEYQSIDPSLDVDGELSNTMKNLEKAILEQTIEIRNLRLSKLLSYRENLNVFRDELEIEMLQKQIQMGGVSASDDSLIPFRISQYNKEKTQLDKYIAELKAALQDPNITQEEVTKIQAEIRDLTKQSLQAQLGIFQELKASSGTFNLPDGVMVMSQYDYMAGKSTHSNFTIQAGDTYVNITLPNVTDKTSSQQLANIGYNLGSAIAKGRIGASYRGQLNGAPWNYPTY